jgi:NAD(P)-dependent dehydrogenase (short-subunit alcohol dehydrogenase family)
MRDKTMQKTILLTGATDGIGLATAKMLLEQGHTVLLHGRNEAKLEAVANDLSTLSGGGGTESYIADLSDMNDVEALAKAIAEKHESLDVLINNAGIFKTPEPVTTDGLDIRFAVNTLAPYLLTLRLIPLLGTAGRVVNLSSAAQAPVDVKAIAGGVPMDDMSAYSQSKLAITMWSRAMAQAAPDGPMVVAVNPGSLLASKMVVEGFGVAGNNINIGADILVRASLSDEFADASGKYFDNDSGQFAPPHPDGLDDAKIAEVMSAIESVLA